MTIPNRELKKFKHWVIDERGYTLDYHSVMCYFNQRDRAVEVKLLGIYVTIGKQPYWLEDIADQFIEGARA